MRQALVRHVPLIAGLLSMALAWAVPLIAWGRLPLADWQTMAALSILCGTGFGYCGWRDWSGRD